MGKFRNVTISYRDGKCQELSVDGVDMRYGCMGYKLEHKGGEAPVLTLKLRCGNPRLLIPARPDSGSME